MKNFKICFEIDTDDNGLEDEVQDMIEVNLDPIDHLGDISIGARNIEEIEEKE